MQPKLLEFLAQGESGQPQPARGFCLVALRQSDRLREDFAFGLGKHAAMSVLDFAPPRPRQQITCEGSEGPAGGSRVGRTIGQGLPHGIGID